MSLLEATEGAGMHWLVASIDRWAPANSAMESVTQQLPEPVMHWPKSTSLWLPVKRFEKPGLHSSLSSGVTAFPITV